VERSSNTESQNDHEKLTEPRPRFRAVMLFLLLAGSLLTCVFADQEGRETWVAFVTGQKAAGYDIYDDFDDNFTNNWWIGFPMGPEYYAALNVTDGAYVWEMKEIYHSMGASFWTGLDDLKPMQDFDMSVDARLASPEATRMCYGLAFRIQTYTANGYTFQVCEDQTFTAYNYSGADQWTFFETSTFSDAIHPGEWNTLSVRARGDHFTLSINDQVVSEFTDTHTAEGRFKLMMISYDDTPGTVMFDNFGLQPRDP
jgi:hypothetical protein